MKPSSQLAVVRPRSFPRPAESGADRPHVLQFYQDERFLAATVADFLAKGLSEGEPALVIASKPHRSAFLDRLSTKGFDIEAVKRDGLLTCLDARDMLATFMVGSMPDPRRFESTIGGAIESALAGKHSKLQAYGEMVDLLWRDGNHAAAIRLEELWNDLLTKYSFSLLCAYSMSNFDQQEQAQSFHGICRRHDRVLPTERYLESGDRLMEVALLQQRSQTLEAEVKRREDVEAALRQALAARQRAERDQDRLAAIVHSSDDAIVSKDLDGIIKSWNPAAERIFGFTPEEAIGKSIRIIIPKERQSEEDRVLASIRRGEIVDHFETIRLRRDGTEVAVSVTVSPVKDATGHVVGASKIARDITERHKLDVERQRILEYEQTARIEAERANRTKDEFLTMLSHELRTPLNAILGWARIATSQEALPRKGNTTMHRAFEVIERNASLQLRLVDDLLDVSRIVAGKLHLTSDPVDLVAVLGTVITTLRPAAEAKAIDLKVRISESSQPVVGDSMRLQQVAWNLLSNAIKFTPASGQIEIRLESAAGGARIVVADTGEGISPEFLPHVFERFRQADSTTTRKHGGLGLGLTVTRYLVEAHGGTISVESAGKGLGTVFTVMLPGLPAEPCVDEQPRVETPIRLDGVRLLVLDDDEDARYLLRCMLEHRGAEVTSVQSGDEALNMLLTKPFDVLLADLGMPGKDGCSLIQAIRSHSAAHVRRIGAVAVTAYSDDAHRTKAVSAGFDGYLVKPVPINRLARAITGLLGRAQ